MLLLYIIEGSDNLATLSQNDIRRHHFLDYWPITGRLGRSVVEKIARTYVIYGWFQPNYHPPLIWNRIFSPHLPYFDQVPRQPVCDCGRFCVELSQPHKGVCTHHYHGPYHHYHDPYHHLIVAGNPPRWRPLLVQSFKFCWKCSTHGGDCSARWKTFVF